MQFTISAAFLALVGSALAQTANFDAITSPTKGQELVADGKQSYTIVWDPTAEYDGQDVSILLLQGASQDTLDYYTGADVASHIDSALGSYKWTPTKDVLGYAVYGLKLQLDSNTTIFQYSFPFQITDGSSSSTGSVVSSSPSSTASQASASSSASSSSASSSSAVVAAQATVPSNGSNTGTTASVTTTAAGAAGTGSGATGTGSGAVVTLTTAVKPSSTGSGSSSTSSSVVTAGAGKIMAGSLAAIGGVMAAMLAL